MDFVPSYKFFVDGLPPLPNRTRGQHWGKTYQEKTEWENRIGWLAKIYKIPALKGKVLVTFIVQVGSNRKVDPDNLMWAVTKPSLDILQKLGILRGDSIDDVELAYKFNRGAKGFWIEIRSLALE